MPASAAMSATRSSCSGASTAKAPLTATASQPAAASCSTAARAALSSRPWVRSRKACSVSRSRPGASPTVPTFERLRALRKSGLAPSPITPTRGTSPSSRAFIACVVEKATSSTDAARSPSVSRSCARAAATPALTPWPCSWLVGTTASATSANGAGSIATAFVNVPPTSTPIRIPPPETACASPLRASGAAAVAPLTAAPPPSAAPAGRRSAVSAGRPRAPRRRTSRAAPPGPRSPRRSGGCRSSRRRRSAASPSRR